MKRPLRSVCFLTACFLASALLWSTGSPATAAQARTAQEIADEWEFVRLANASRAQAGLGALEGQVWVEDARNHSERMAQAKSIFHDTNLAAQASAFSSCWTAIAENVGLGPTVAELHTALMQSSSHRRNLLGDYDTIGVGVERSADATIYVTQRFMKLRPGCGDPQPQPEEIVGTPAPVVSVAPSAPPPVPAPKPVLAAPRPVRTTPPLLRTATATPPVAPTWKICWFRWDGGFVCHG
jgi:hypothetical protein